jgi:hypothetical protein
MQHLCSKLRRMGQPMLSSSQPAEPTCFRRTLAIHMVWLVQLLGRKGHCPTAKKRRVEIKHSPIATDGGIKGMSPPLRTPMEMEVGDLILVMVPSMELQREQIRYTSTNALHQAESQARLLVCIIFELGYRDGWRLVRDGDESRRTNI